VGTEETGAAGYHRSSKVSPHCFPAPWQTLITSARLPWVFARQTSPSTYSAMRNSRRKRGHRPRTESMARRMIRDSPRRRATVHSRRSAVSETWARWPRAARWNADPRGGEGDDSSPAGSTSWVDLLDRLPGRLLSRRAAAATDSRPPRVPGGAGLHGRLTVVRARRGTRSSTGPMATVHTWATPDRVPGRKNVWR